MQSYPLKPHDGSAGSLGCSLLFQVPVFSLVPCIVVSLGFVAVSMLLVRLSLLIWVLPVLILFQCNGHSHAVHIVTVV